MWWFFSFDSWFLIFYSFVLGGVLASLVFLLSFYMDCVSLSEYGYLSSFFMIDYCSLILGLLTVLLFFVLFMCGVRSLYIYISVFSALVSYVSVNVFIFWFFYELSIICTLLLLVSSSSYPERYSAGWYFGGYIFLSSVPLLISITLLSFISGSFYYFSWAGGGGVLNWLICIMFLSKVPIPPFHVWLPLVHAEANSPTSIILSGYIMKLGVLGLLRFGGGVLNSDIFFGLIIFLCGFGLLFMLNSYLECDAKRWLAMMSLFHILVSIVLCIYGNFGVEVFSLYYCFGHGLAAGVMFIIIWWGYSYINSRDWQLLSCVLGGVTGIQILVGLAFLCVAGFPPTPQFLCELIMMISVLTANDVGLILLLSFFVFGGSLLVFVIYSLIIGSVGWWGGCWRSGLDSYLLSVLFLSLLGLVIIFFI